MSKQDDSLGLRSQLPNNSKDPVIPSVGMAQLLELAEKLGVLLVRNSNEVAVESCVGRITGVGELRVGTYEIPRAK